jgi:hypothetical protein
LALVSLLGVSLAHSVEGPARDVRRNRFGAMEIVEEVEGLIKKQVMWPLKHFRTDYVQQAEFLNEAREQVKVNQERLKDDQLYTCTNRDEGDKDSAGYFLPIFVADLN